MASTHAATSLPFILQSFASIKKDIAAITGVLAICIALILSIPACHHHHQYSA